MALPVDILKTALMQGKDGRAEILRHMLTVINKPKPNLAHMRHA